MAVSHAVHLLERESELAELAGGIAGARTGAGRLVLVEGPAGIGKTELLTAARSLGDEAGLVVASARGSELEHGFAFGVVRQLFEPVLRLCSPAQKSQLLTGQARLAAGVLGVGVGGSTRRGSGLPDVLQGLYWLTLNLAERARLLVVIDDAHWADRSSLRFISYLAGRLDEAGVLAVLAVRSDERADDDLLAAVARERTSRVMGLRPLSEDATGQLIAGEYHEEGEPEFVQACRAATGGNPFFLRELLRALRADGIPPTAAEVERVAGQGPASVARSVLTRIGGLSRAAGDVAQALSVLGGEAGLREITWVCSLDEELVVAAVDDLARAGIVVGPDPVVFAHPIVQASIYADIPSGERAPAHLRAARSLARAGAPAERVAAHLLVARPARDQWAVGVLREAAVEALSRGAADGAAAYLHRALAEAPADGDRGSVLALLGRAEYLADQPGASGHLVEAMTVAPSVVERGELALEAAKALIMAEPDRSQAAIELLDRAITELDKPDSQLSMRLEAQLLAAAGLKLSTRPLHLERLGRVYPRTLGDEPADRLLLANLANWTLIEGRTPGRFEDLARHAGTLGSPVELARRVAERAIAGGQLLREEGSDSELSYIAIGSLWMGDFLGEAEYWLGRALADARERGSVVGYAQASAFQADVAYRQGKLGDARAHAEAAATVSQGDALAVMINVLIEQAQLEEAERMLDRYPLAPDADHFMLQPIRAAAARLQVARGRTAQGADQLLACGQWLETWGAENPALVAWRSSAALALDHEDDRASDLAAEEVALALALGQSRALGIALRAQGLLERGASGIDLLRQAVTAFEHSPARLEHARALIDYGAALRRAGHRTDARMPLRQGLDLAHQCAGIVLAERARQELLATGARPRRLALSGRDALTPTEDRVAEMAAEGRSTPEIAQALFVTPKTVETHLAHIYQKLNIHTRTELALLHAGTDGRG